MIKIPNKTLTTSALLLSAMAVSSSLHAAIIDLDIAPAGDYFVGDEQVVTTAVSFGGATFNINYTLTAYAPDVLDEDGTTEISDNPYVRSSGTGYGIGSDSDTSQESTLDGARGEGIGFYNLSITDFVGGTGSDAVQDISDITELSFYSFTATADGHARDAATISFTGFGVDPTAAQNLSSDADTARIVNIKSNWSAEADAMYLTVGNANSKNRWSVSGLAVTIIPEPNSYALLAGLSFVMLRRRQA
jgi:hypothetical protein